MLKRIEECPQQDIERLLALIGGRVREARSKRGMSRRVLSETSGVSPRYLAQLEAGQGNISVALLFKIARALGLPLERLVQLSQTSQQRKGQRIALIGLRGAGKSTLGQRAATHLGMGFLELKHDIEAASGIGINEVFSLYGEEGYRSLERQSLERIWNNNEALVLAVGGGIVADTQSYSYLLTHFHTIWLHAEPEEHMQRVRAQGDERPMAGNPDAMVALKRILAGREVLYSKADAEVSTARSTPDESLKAMLKTIEVKGFLKGTPG